MSANDLLQGYYKATGQSSGSSTPQLSGSANSFLIGYQNALQNKSNPTTQKKSIQNKTKQISSNPLTGSQKALQTLQYGANMASSNIQKIIGGLRVSLITPSQQRDQIDKQSQQLPQTISIKPNQKSLTPIQMKEYGLSARLTPASQMKADYRSQQLKKAVGNTINSVAGPLAKAEYEVERNTPYGAVAQGIRDTMAPIIKNIDPNVEARYEKFTPKKEETNLSKTLRFVGQQIPYIPLALAAEYVAGVAGLSALAKVVPKGTSVATNIASKTAQGALKGVPVGAILGALPKTDTFKERVKNTAEGAALVGVLAGLGSALSLTAGELVFKYGKDVKTFVANKDLIERTLNTVNPDPEDLAKLKQLNLSGRFMEAFKSKAGIEIQTSTEKGGKVWDVLRSMFPDHFVPETGKATAAETKIIQLLGEGEKTPQEVLGAVIKSGEQNTPAGRELVKTALEAQKTGQNITLEAPIEQKPVERAVTAPKTKAVSDIPPELQPLVEEAKKYKSAEEFVQSQGELLYHGTPNLTDSKQMGKLNYPIYSSSNKDYASVYQTPSASSNTPGKVKGTPGVLELVKNPKARVLDIRDAKGQKVLKDYWANYSTSGEQVPTPSGLPDWTEGTGIAEYIKDKKLPYDAFLLDEGGVPFDNGVRSRGESYVALNENAFYTKSQLTDLYNKATKPVEIPVAKTEIKVGEKTPQEVAGLVISNGLEGTPEGKEIMKTVIEAQNTGQNITIEPPTAEAPIDDLVSNTPEEVASKTLTGKSSDEVVKTLNTYAQESLDKNNLDPIKDEIDSVFSYFEKAEDGKQAQKDLLQVRAGIQKSLDLLQDKNGFEIRDARQGLEGYYSLLEDTIKKIDEITRNPKPYTIEPNLVTSKDRRVKPKVDGYIVTYNGETYKDKNWNTLDSKMRKMTGYKTYKEASRPIDKAKEYVSKKDTTKFRTATDLDKTGLTTKLLKKLEGREKVSKQFISDLTNSPDLKQTEKDLIRSILADEGDSVNVGDFSSKVKAELLPLKIRPGGSSTMKSVDDYKYNPRYENISLPEESRGRVKNYKENVYQSPIDTSAGAVHFGEETTNYFGHTRIEDMADNKTRRVIEVQSDLYQKGNLEKEVGTGYDFNYLKELEAKKAAGEMYSKSDLANLQAVKKELEKNPSKNPMKLYQYNDPTAHFRMIREEIKKAAQDGKTKLQFPTGETAMKIEGLAGQGNPNFLHYEDSTALKPSDLQIGQKFNDQRHGHGGNFIVVERTGNETFKAIPLKYEAPEILQESNYGEFTKEYMDTLNKYIKQNKSLIEEFSIAEKIDTNNPIYKFYEKEVGKYLKSKYGAKPVTDDQGVTWMEVDIKPEMAGDVEAFRLKDDFKEVTGVEMTDAQEAELTKLNEEIFGDTDIKVVSQILANRDALGSYRKGMINIIEGQANPKDTFYHEAVHKYLDVFTTKDEQVELLMEAQKEYNLDSFAEVEEKLAEDFIGYAKSREGYMGGLKKFFDMILTRIKAYLGKVDRIDQLYQEIMAGKAAQKVKEVEVPRSQIPVGEGKKKYSRLEARQKGYLDEIDSPALDDSGLRATFDEVNREENRRKAAEFIEKEGPEAALEVLQGKRQAPEGILNNSIYMALQDLSLDDSGLGLRLASISSTRAGQEISALAGMDRNSPVALAKEIFKITEEKFDRRFGGKKRKKVVEGYNDKGKFIIEESSPTLSEWGALLDKLEC